MNMALRWKLVPASSCCVTRCVCNEPVNVYSVQQTFILIQFGLKSVLCSALNDNTL